MILVSDPTGVTWYPAEWRALRHKNPTSGRWSALELSIIYLRPITSGLIRQDLVVHSPTLTLLVAASLLEFLLLAWIQVRPAS